MPKMINLSIDGHPVTVPEGTLIVNAAKLVGNAIPVFCYHPKMEPVGMCRMCLVEVGRPMIDRATGQPVLDENGQPKLQFGPKMETACTTPVSEGMLVVTESEKVKAARKEVLEFILTSHPLDCPICDKGGECPLQNLTLAYGPSSSRFLFDEKMHLEKHVALGELIFLDRERCIQCGRCVRFQHEVVDDPVINFYERGRSMEIMTFSEPGFDSIWSGNTSDICPVGALTTSDFHFRARPWEMKASASICNHCPVGCNIVHNVRREAKQGGRTVIKRVMPRQNEAVNEIWICDKGRFAYHHTESPERLTQPLLRKEGALQPVSWDEALDLAAAKIKAAGAGSLVLAGGRLPNEDLFNLRQLAEGVGGKALLYSQMAGGELTAQVGVGPGSNLGDLGKGAVILVVASDLHEEAPVWWLRVKQAAERGAILIVLNGRATRLEKHAAHVLRYVFGEEAAAVRALMAGDTPAAQAFKAAEQAVILFGSDGLGLAASSALAAACADVLIHSGHAGKSNSGLIGVWPHGNTQGAFDMGLRPAADLPAELSSAKLVLVAAADPAGDDPALSAVLDGADFVIVQELFLTPTAQKADLVLPVQADGEREGTLTSGERRVQRFYPAVAPLSEARPDFMIAAQLGARLGLALEGRAASLVLLKIGERLPAYAGLTYARLAESKEQWPIIGRHDLFYGGTTYDNHQGLGVQLAPAYQPGMALDAVPAALPTPALAADELLLVPVTRLYDRGALTVASPLLQQRLAEPAVTLHPDSAERFGLQEGGSADVSFNGLTARVAVHVDAGIPAGVALLPRSVGLPLHQPAACRLRAVSAERTPVN